MNWIQLTDIESVNKINDESKNHPEKGFVIFKHSTSCGTSRMALKMFEAGWENSLPAYFINVLQNRSASNFIASHYNVEHESPQVLVIKNGKSIYNASHSAIDPNEVAGKL